MALFKKKTVRAVLNQAYLDNMEFYGRLFIKAKQTIDHLEGEEFAEAWEEMVSEFRRKCADDAIKALTQISSNSIDRADQYYKTKEVPGLVGEIEYLNHTMEPVYAFCVLYYIFTGKKFSEIWFIYAKKVDTEIKLMTRSWLRMWETNYRNREPLYMGNFKPQMEYKHPDAAE